jgi:hypothetical protein
MIYYLTLIKATSIGDSIVMSFSLKKWTMSNRISHAIPNSIKLPRYLSTPQLDTPPHYIRDDKVQFSLIDYKIMPSYVKSAEVS